MEFMRELDRDGVSRRKSHRVRCRLYLSKVS